MNIMGDKLYYFKFVTGDWMTDPLLGICRPATRGIWIDLLCVMHLKRTYELTGTMEELSQICRCTVGEMEAAIEELKSRNVADVTVQPVTLFSGHVTPCDKKVTPSVTVVSRRIKRECNARGKTRKRVSRWRLRNRDEKVTSTVTPNGTPNGTPPVTGGVTPYSYSYSYIKENTIKENGLYFSEKFGEKFRSHWLAWVELRLKLKKPKDWEGYFKGMFKKLHQYSEENACSILELTTLNQYVGLLFDRYPTGDVPANSKPVARPPQPESAWSIQQRIDATKKQMADIREAGRPFNLDKREYIWDKQAFEKFKEMKLNLNKLESKLAKAS